MSNSRLKKQKHNTFYKEIIGKQKGGKELCYAHHSKQNIIYDYQRELR